MFTHLHLHTEFSLLDGACRIEQLVLRAKELGMQSLAITDHGNMYGAVDFYKACKKHGIKPIIGCEVYVAPRTRFDKEKALDKVDVLDRPELYRKKAKISFDPAVVSGNDVMQVRDISMGYDDRILFKGLNFEIYRGEKVALIGPNGIGKSTLFKIIMNELTPLSGEVKLGTNVNVAYFHQEQKTLNLDNTIIDEICREKHIELIESDNTIQKLSKKDNCFAIAIIKKYEMT